MLRRARERRRSRSRLRDADDWISFEDAIGRHDIAAVRESVATLAAEGMIELVDGCARLGIE